MMPLGLLRIVHSKLGMLHGSRGWSSVRWLELLQLNRRDVRRRRSSTHTPIDGLTLDLRAIAFEA
jgi:hypothetical protein